MLRSLDAFEQGVLAQRLLDEINGAGLHCWLGFAANTDIDEVQAFVEDDLEMQKQLV
jgi:hypothetical protein